MGLVFIFFFFFQAEDGIRDADVTGVQTCALPIFGWKDPFSLPDATSRQDRYGHRFGDGSYTPEIVVDGASSHVGSYREEVGAASDAARRDGTTAASLSVTKERNGLAIDVGAGQGHGRLLLIGFDH